MSANIASKNGKYSIAVVGEPAWHGLGQVLEEKMTSKEAIIHAGLDFTVTKTPIYFKETDELYNKFEGRVATVRTDTNRGLGIVSPGYEIVQNTEAFDFFDDIVSEGKAIYTTAGALYKGETIFITAKLPDYIKVKDEAIDKYLLLMNTHDGTASITIMFTPIRVVCNNTLHAAISGKGTKIRIRHSRDVHSKLQQANRALGIANILSVEAGVKFNKWINTPMKDNDVKLFLAKTFLSKDDYLIEQQRLVLKDTISSRGRNLLINSQNYYFNGLGQKDIRGTLYGAYNAVTGYINNDKKFTDEDQYTAYSKRTDNILFGDGYKKGQGAFDLACLIENNTEDISKLLITI